MKTSIFDIFKVGIGPSSSHTVGPMRGAGRFIAGLQGKGMLSRTERVLGELYGSLALTGIGHGTDRAVLLGLAGETPEEVQPNDVEDILAEIRGSRQIRLLKRKTIPFIEERDLLFRNDQKLPGHSNGMKFSAFDGNGELLGSEIYYSIGGGFVVCDGEKTDLQPKPLPVPHPFFNGAELLETAEARGISVAQFGGKRQRLLIVSKDCHVYKCSRANQRPCGRD